jgi:hypothetical protein
VKGAADAAWGRRGERERGGGGERERGGGGGERERRRGGREREEEGREREREEEGRERERGGGGSRGDLATRGSWGAGVPVVVSAVGMQAARENGPEMTMVDPGGGVTAAPKGNARETQGKRGFSDSPCWMRSELPLARRPSIVLRP